MTKVLSSEDNNSEDDAEDSGNGEEEEDITPDRRNAGRSTIESSFHKHERTLDMEYAESDSDLGADKERSTYPAHDDHNIPKEDDNHDEEAMDDNESTPKWELNLPERAQHLSRKQGGKTGFFLFILIHFLLEEFSIAKRKTGTGTSRYGDDFFQIKNMEASESAVLDSRKGYIPKVLKAESQNGEQETNDDEDNASDADSSIP